MELFHNYYAHAMKICIIFKFALSQRAHEFEILYIKLAQKSSFRMKTCKFDNEMCKTQKAKMKPYQKNAALYISQYESGTPRKFH